jgi:predicted  nucleic acid-binding Zn-ribbon protein
MLPELEHLIRLQELETRAADARRRIAEAPGRIAALDAKLTAAREALAAAKQAVADNQARRRTIERDLIAAQQRLSKSKETLMAVKTNQEYHAMQTQIAAGTAEVERIEEQMLVNMVEADDLAVRLKEAEARLKSEEAQLAKERSDIEGEVKRLEEVLSSSQTERAALVPQIPRELYEEFERLLKARQGIAVAEAADGHCTVCHVRLRPQMFNVVMRNDSIVHCDSCQRILFFRRTRAAEPAVNEAAVGRHADSDSARS